MTAVQSIKLYQILGKYFNNDVNAQRVVEEIETVIDVKLEAKKEVLATKEDIYKLHEKLNDQFKWTVGTMIALTGLVLALSKIF